MRWAIVRLIWFREFRDLLRDRRTLFLVMMLPVLLYPGIGAVGLIISWAMAERPSVIGLTGSPPNFPARAPSETSQSLGGLSPVSAAACLALLPEASLDRAIGAVALVQASLDCLDYPQFVVNGRLAGAFLVAGNDADRLRF